MPRGRPSKIKKVVCAKKEHTEHPYQNVINAMSVGASPAEVQKILGIGKSTYYDRQQTDPEFKEAIEKGMAAGEAWYWQKARERFEAGDDKGHKYFLQIIGKVYGYEKNVVSETNININNNTLNLHQNKSREELLDYIRDELIENRLIDVKSIHYQPRDENSG